jgi:hypothetical protein
MERPCALSPLPFALVLLSIAWTGCLGEMIMVRRDSSSPLFSANLGHATPNVMSGNFIHLSSYLVFSIRC